MSLRLAFLSLAIVYFTGCALKHDDEQPVAKEKVEQSAPVDRTHSVYASLTVKGHSELYSGSANDVQGFDFQKRSPIEFLDHIRLSHDAIAMEQFSFSYTMWGTHRGWVQKSDLPLLLDRIESENPCLAINKSICSFFSMKPSTVGQEAAHLLLSFRSEVEQSGYGGYPCLLNSGSFPIDKKQIKQWCEAYIAANK